MVRDQVSGAKVTGSVTNSGDFEMTVNGQLLSINSCPLTITSPGPAVSVPGHYNKGCTLIRH